MRVVLVLFLLALTLVPRPAHALSQDDVTEYSRIVFFGPVARRDEALEALVARGRLDVAPALVLAIRYRGGDPAIMRSLRALTGKPFKNWKDAMLWQEARPDIVPHRSFAAIKVQILTDIDPGFRRFLGDGRAARGRLAVRLEEIVWGGAWADAIPPLDHPKMIDADDADYLNGDDLVFGVAINGDIRAYPLRILGWHEMMNDRIGGVAVALAYCPLCGSGILYETEVEGFEEPFVFGSSGLLYRSNKLMFDRQTESLWHHLTGKPVGGPLYPGKVRLKTRPMAIARWSDWRARHPETRVLALKTGYTRNYASGFVYHDYFASPDLLYPARAEGDEATKTLNPKSHVFGLQTVGAAKAWPLAAFANRSVLNDTFAGKPIVLVGNERGRTVRAYEGGAAAFSQTGDPTVLRSDGQRWTVTEHALVGPAGERRPRLPGRVTYWFAWNNHLNFESDVFKGD
ncbi:MAG: DUF3179 domain-containing protein [Pseudomonadota bacterium]